MNNKMDCHIVKDLMPSYVDGISSNATNAAVEEHVKECPDCAEVLKNMKEPERRQTSPEVEVDYLKKVRKRTSQVGIICGIVMMIIGMVLIFSKVYIIGNVSNGTDETFNVSVKGNTVYVEGSVKSSTSGVGRVAFEESAGIVNIKVYTVPRAFFNDSEFSEEYTAQNDSVGMVRCGDLILWYDGEQISEKAARIYATMNPFLGDMPANVAIADILGIEEQLGHYTNELQTETEPFGWTLKIEKPIMKDKEAEYRDIMSSDAYILIGSIENLGYVTWEYKTGEGSKTLTITEKDASNHVGFNIKECSKSPVKLQSLM